VRSGPISTVSLSDSGPTATLGQPQAAAAPTAAPTASLAAASAAAPTASLAATSTTSLATTPTASLAATPTASLAAAPTASLAAPQEILNEEDLAINSIYLIEIDLSHITSYKTLLSIKTPAFLGVLQEAYTVTETGVKDQEIFKLVPNKYNCISLNIADVDKPPKIIKYYIKGNTFPTGIFKSFTKYDDADNANTARDNIVLPFMENRRQRKQARSHEGAAGGGGDGTRGGGKSKKGRRQRNKSKKHQRDFSK
jgi:hypothetical protein